MPLAVETIFAFAKEVSLEVLGAAMLLRCWAWHQVPVGSLPDNDEALAAMVGLRRDVWQRVRAQALYGFTVCSECVTLLPIGNKASGAGAAEWIKRRRSNAQAQMRRRRKKRQVSVTPTASQHDNSSAPTPPCPPAIEKQTPPPNETWRGRLPAPPPFEPPSVVS
jgi:hypothetical protein